MPEMTPPPLTTINDLFCRISAAQNPRAILWQDEFGNWQPLSSDQIYQRVHTLSEAFLAWGAKKGDRIALISENRWEWIVSDLAILAINAVNVPIYPTLTGEQIAVLLADAGCRIAVVSTRQQFDKLNAVRSQTPLEQILVMDGNPPNAPDGAIAFSKILAGADDSGSYRDPVFDALVRSVKPGDLATLIYTSGTTGEPKGVMLTHGNISSNALTSLETYNFLPDDVALSFLPLAHVYERTMDYGYLFRGISVAYLEKMETVAEALLEVHPTMTAAVPRFFEKMYANILEKGHRESGLKRQIFDWALRVAAKAVPWRAYGKRVSGILRLKWRAADAIVYSKIREGVGGRIRTFCSGGAPLAQELAEFFWSVNLPVYQGYGLTETSPIVAANLPTANKIGTVGKPIPDVQVKIAEDGEVLVKGPCVMRGYYHKSEDTRAVFTPDGFFCTGDIGKLDEDGYLVITDRKKELLKTAGGKFVAPAPIENLLKTSQFITNAMVVGDRRKFVSVLIVPDFTAIVAEARKSGRELSPEQMTQDAWVRELLSREVERLTASLAQYEKPKRFAVLERDFSYAQDELTYTLKLKRRVIERHYEDVIERLYADVEEPRPQHMV